jgi:hypothetical protein
VRAQEGGNASPTMNKILPVTTTKDRRVAWQTPTSMRVNSESVSNKIDEKDDQQEIKNMKRNYDGFERRTRRNCL